MGSFLDKPITTTTRASLEKRGLRCGTSCMQGWRVDMEDAHIVEVGLPGHDDLSYFAVLDGHGGDLAAQHSAANLVRHIVNTEEFNTKPLVPGLIQGGLKKAYLSMDAELRELPAVRRGEDHSGCTLVGVMVTDTHIICANSGDSRAILVRKDEIVPLSEDHKPYNDTEQKRIEAAGGSVSLRRVNGDLAVSRALGDFSYKQRTELPPEQQQVTADPDFVVEERKDTDHFIIIACDGIWDVMNNEECGEFVRRTIADGCDDLAEACDVLIHECLSKGSRDNMSAIIVALPGAPRPTGEKIDAFEKFKASRAEGASGGGGGGAGSGSGR